MKYSLLALCFAFLVSCSSSDDEKDYRAENEAEIVAYVADNGLNATRSNSGLYYVIDEQGTGVKPTSASIVRVAYKGYYTNESVFDESDENGITLALSQVIAGWTEGITYFNEGGSGMLLIPAHLGYGSKDDRGIPAGSVLIFEITVISPEMTEAKNEAEIAAYVEANSLDATRSDSGLYYVIDEPGIGAQPTETSNVTVSYKGYFLDGSAFDESSVSGVEFALDEVIPGWSEGIAYFKEGGRGKLLIPSHLAYGNYEYSGIPGGSVLIFDINLISVNE
jgi:FKBP-type peptidyl-prolyl cis-trans isomerase FkpA